MPELPRLRILVSTGLTEMASTSTSRSWPYAIGFSNSKSNKASGRSTAPGSIKPTAFIYLPDALKILR